MPSLTVTLLVILLLHSLKTQIKAVTNQQLSAVLASGIVKVA